MPSGRALLGKLVDDATVSLALVFVGNIGVQTHAIVGTLINHKRGDRCVAQEDEPIGVVVIWIRLPLEPKPLEFDYLRGIGDRSVHREQGFDNVNELAHAVFRSVHLPDEDNLTLANATVDRFGEANAWSFDDFEILGGEHPQAATEQLEAWVFDEDVDGNLAVRFPPPAITEVEKHLAHVAIGDEVDDIHGDELVVRVLDDAEVFLVLHHAIREEREFL